MNELTYKQKLILTSKNLYKSILILALPVFLSNILKSLHDIIDMYFVSNLIAPDAVEASISAISLTGPIFAISQSLALGFMIAGSAIMAQAMGAQKFEKAKKIAGQLVLLCGLSGIFFNILVYFLTPSIMTAMGATGQTLDLSILYVRIRSFEMIPLFLFYSFQAMRQSSGDTVLPVILNIVSVILNILLTWIFIYFFNMGVSGAAYSTLIANIVIVPVFIIIMFKHNGNNVYIDFDDLRIDFQEMKLIAKLGIPSALSQAFASLGFLILNGLILDYGNATVNAFSVGNRINSLVLMPAMATGGIVSTFVGQNIGAKNYARAKKSVFDTMVITLSIMLVGALIMIPLRRQLAGLFLANTPDALDLCVDYLFYILAGLPLMGIFQVFMGTYQGCGQTKFTLILSTSRLWIFRIPAVLIFKNVLFLPNSSIWYAMIISNFLAAFLGIVLYVFCKFDVNILDKKKIKGA